MMSPRFTLFQGDRLRPPEKREAESELIYRPAGEGAVNPLIVDRQRFVDRLDQRQLDVIVSIFVEIKLPVEIAGELHDKVSAEVKLIDGNDLEGRTSCPSVVVNVFVQGDFVSDRRHQAWSVRGRRNRCLLVRSQGG